MNYEKILCEFQNFIKAYLSLEHKQHRILDLNLSEVHLLKVAEQNPNYTLIEYAEKLKVSRSAITQLVNLLEKKDCVKKKKANKKSFVLELTSKGEIVCNKHDEEHKKIENDLRRIFKKYSSDRDTLRVECKSAVFHADFLLLRLSRFGNSTGLDASS